MPRSRDDRHRDPDPAVAVHDGAGRPEEHDLDERGGGEHERGLRGVEPDVLRPQRHDDDPRGPGQPDGEHAEPDGEEHAAVPRDDLARPARALVPGRRTPSWCEPEVGGAPGERRGEHTRDDRDPERRLRTPPSDDRCPDSGPTNRPMRVTPPEGRHGPGPQRDRVRPP